MPSPLIAAVASIVLGAALIALVEWYYFHRPARERDGR